ncbi:hypothetical protein FOZ62_019641, partial [Perkinsus olseni]
MGVNSNAIQGEDEEEDEDDLGSGDEVDYRQSNQYGEALKKQKTEAVSEFAKSHTIAEQRRSLPVYEVREQFLHVLREHQVVVVVGETGSGKTTQLT